MLDDCGNSSFQLFFRHILIDIWTKRNTVNVINETRFEKENYYSLTVKEHQAKHQGWMIRDGPCYTALLRSLLLSLHWEEG